MGCHLCDRLTGPLLIVHKECGHPPLTQEQKARMRAKPRRRSVGFIPEVKVVTYGARDHRRRDWPRWMAAS